MAWTHDLSANQQALLSAALRHVSDARSLLPSSPAQAAYLAGYGPECARKASLAPWKNEEEERRNRMIGHRFDAPAETALRWFCDLDPLASRYALRGWRHRYPVLGEWSESARYGRSDSVSRGKAERMVNAAERLTESTVALLWADGRSDSLQQLVETRP